MAQHHDYPYATVPRLWPGGTVVCMASGPSLTPEDAEYVRGKADGVIVVNTTYQMAPWADSLIAADFRWWMWNGRKVKAEFRGSKFATSRHVGELSDKHGWDVQVLRNTGRDGLELSPDGLRHGLNTGYRALGLAYHTGARRVILLGYDMKRGGMDADGKPYLPSKQCKEHWHPDHPIPSRSLYKPFRKCFETIVEPLREAGLEVINCTPESALTVFPMMPLREALKPRMAVAS